MHKAISFDFWNTLANVSPRFIEARDDYFHSLGLTDGTDRYKHVKTALDRAAEDEGKAVSPLMAVKQFVDPFPISVNHYEISAKFQQMALEYPPELLPPEPFKELAKNVPIFICSNVNFISGDTLRQLLDGYDFSFMAFSNEIGVSKPAKDIFHAILHHARHKNPDIEPNDILHIGDRLCDQTGAESIGMQTQRVTGPKNTAQVIKQLLKGFEET